MMLKLGGGEPLYLQVYRALCGAIEDGRFAPGTRLPGTRTLARELGVSRTVVLQAFEQLESEGITVGNRGSGTYVRVRAEPEPTEAWPRPLRTTGAEASPPLAFRSDLPAPSPWALRTVGALPGTDRVQAAPLDEGMLDFTDLRPFQDTRGHRRWRQALADALDDGRGMPQDVQGLPELREALALELRQERDIEVDPKDILVVSGIQQARDLIARVLVQPGMAVGVEDPGYRGVRTTFAAAGARVQHCAVGPDGLDVDAHAVALAEARLLYVMPAQQFPTGAVMPEALRLRVLAWAYRQGAYVVEDDFEPEHRLVSQALPPLFALDRRQQVIYIGAFAREFFPALRMAYVIAPPALRPYLEAAKWVADRGAGFLMQRALARYLASGEYQRNLRRLFVLLAARRERLLASLARHFGDRAVADGEAASGTLLVHFPAVPAARAGRLVEQAASCGVRVGSAHVYYAHPPAHLTLLLRYAHVPNGRIDEAVRRLAEAYDGLVQAAHPHAEAC
ncbi:MAG: PLP-dependent aminotransferase family protein [Xanthomonadaceae bacterium]|nr:PLP-dependent aminotransferase family protein [Xanthomonadaceae bacterium]MDE1962548.1 PLP-dependent aminotransferase family protein [Xanthomonadaceae bacterium]